MKAHILTASIALTVLVAPVAAEAGIQKTKNVDWGPRSSKAAAKLVDRNGFEPRPGNRARNHRVPGRKLLKRWRKRSEMPYARFVNGRFRGTTDEIIQWAARKWGFNTNLMRAVATVESWWEMSTRGDNGDSFGLYQVRRPYHCWGKCKIARYYTAFNADYFGAILRSYYDGRQTWLLDEEGGRPYRSGDLKGSLGAWYSGRWGLPSIQEYLNNIEVRRKERTWHQPYFIGR